jgi:Protein of unknown function (DUF3631)
MMCAPSAPCGSCEFCAGLDGAGLLDDVEAFIRRFCALPSEAAYVAVTLWAAHTHLAARFDSTPRLALLSAEKQSGKTRTLELLELLCVGAEMLSDASPAFMFRRIAGGAVTVLLDECDAIWKRGKPDESTEALRSIVNTGHRKRGTVGRVEMVGKTAELMRFRVYAPVALAGIGNCLPDTILDRSVIIPMRRRAPDERVEQYRERTSRPVGERLAEDLAVWAAGVEHRIGDPWPQMPDGVADRPADVWEPLLAVAEVAGGDWPKRAREACKAFVKDARDDTVSLGQRLLADLRDVFGDRDVMSSAEICRSLAALEEAPWADMHDKPIDARRLSKMLGAYGAKPKTVRIGDSTPRGYTREDLVDPWRRYLSISATGATSATPLASHVADVADVADAAADSPLWDAYLEER